MATGARYGMSDLHAYQAEINWVTHNIRVSLHTSAYVPNVDTHEYVSHLTNEVASGGGYSTGGFPIGNKAVVYDPATNETRMRGDNITIVSASLTFRYAVIADRNAGVSTAQPLFGYVNYLSNQAPAGTDYIIAWQATGIGVNTALAEA